MLKKETLTLPDIVEILGPRPFPMKENLMEYMTELKERQDDEKAAEETNASDSNDSEVNGSGETIAATLDESIL